MVPTIERIDDSPLDRKRRLIRWVDGRRIKTRWWFDDSEPTTGPIRKYPKIDLNYFQNTADRSNYQISLRPWTDDNRSKDRHPRSRREEPLTSLRKS